MVGCAIPDLEAYESLLLLRSQWFPGPATGSISVPVRLSAMPVEIDIAHVAKLARIWLSEAELELYARQLGDILEHAESVQAIATPDVPPTSHPLTMTNAFRVDEVQPSLDRDEVLEMAPDAVGEFFRVPRILDEATDGSE